MRWDFYAGTLGCVMQSTPHFEHLKKVSAEGVKPSSCQKDRSTLVKNITSGRFRYRMAS